MLRSIFKTLIVMTLVFATGGADARTARSRTQVADKISSDYQSIVVAGPVDAKSRIAFFWSATSTRSLDEFRTRLKDIVSDKTLKGNIVISQVFDIENHDTIGPGALLLCSEHYLEYARNVVSYLRTASNVTALTEMRTRNDQLFYTNGDIKNMIKKRKLDFRRCTQNGKFFARQLQTAAKSKQFHQKRPSIALPAYLIDGASCKIRGEIRRAGLVCFRWRRFAASAGSSRFAGRVLRDFGRAPSAARAACA